MTIRRISADRDRLIISLSDLLIGFWACPSQKPRVALSAASPRADYRAVGFPLQSLTRNAQPTQLSTLIGTLRKAQVRWSFMSTARFGLIMLFLQLHVLSFGQKKGDMTVVFDVTATPDSTMSSLGIQIVTDNERENKIRGKREASSSAGLSEWRSVKMRLAKSAFEGRTVTIRAYTDPMECMALYRDLSVLLEDGQHYAIALVRDEDRWQARKTRASMMFTFPRQAQSIDTTLSRTMVRSVEVEVFKTDVETVFADSALIAYEISADCTVGAREVLVPFTQLRSALTDQCFEKLQHSLRQWNTGCTPAKDVQQWIYWKQR